MGVKLEGFKEWEKKLRNAEKALGFVAANTVSEILDVGYKIAFDECPQGPTGFLRSSIYTEIIHDSSGNEIGILGVSAPYSRYVNEGTSKTKRRPFFSNAVIAMNIALYRVLEKNTKLALQGQLKEQKHAGQGTKGGLQQLRPRKHLYQTYSRSGAKRYVFAKGFRPGTVKFRGKIYRGRNYASRFESA